VKGALREKREEEEEEIQNNVGELRVALRKSTCLA